MEVRLPSIKAAAWHKAVTQAILAVTTEFGIEPDEPGIIVHIPQSRPGLERLGILTISWYIDKRRWGIKILWPPECKPTMAWIREQIRVHLENFALKYPTRWGRRRTWR